MSQYTRSDLSVSVSLSDHSVRTHKFSHRGTETQRTIAGLSADLRVSVPLCDPSFRMRTPSHGDGARNVLCAILIGSALLSNLAAAQEAPKAVVVVAGDPDAATQARALEFEAALEEGGISLPVDTALRGALRGDPGTEDDGLEGARRERRRLGFGEEDATTLVRIGRLTGAHAVVVVQSGAEPSVFDVGASAFFENPTGEVAGFVRRAVRSAARRAAEPAPEPTGETEVQAEARAPSPRETAERETAAEEARARADSTPEPERPARAFFKKNWPYFVAGLLLAGAVTWLIVAGGRDDDVPPPVLRFQPGDVL